MLSINHRMPGAIIERGINTFLSPESELDSGQNGNDQNEMEKEKLASFLNFYKNYWNTNPTSFEELIKQYFMHPEEEEIFCYLVEPLEAIRDKFPKPNIKQHAPKLYYLLRDYLINIALFKLFKAVEIEAAQENEVPTILKQIKKELRKLKNSINSLVNQEFDEKPTPHYNYNAVFQAAMLGSAGVAVLAINFFLMYPLLGPIDEFDQKYKTTSGLAARLGLVIAVIASLAFIFIALFKLKNFITHHHLPENSIAYHYKSVEEYKEKLKKLFLTLPEYYSIKEKKDEDGTHSLKFFYPRKKLVADKSEEIKVGKMDLNKNLGF